MPSAGPQPFSLALRPTPFLCPQKCLRQLGLTTAPSSACSGSSGHPWRRAPCCRSASMFSASSLGPARPPGRGSDLPRAGLPPSQTPLDLLAFVPPSLHTDFHPAAVSQTQWPPGPFPAVGHSSRSGTGCGSREASTWAWILVPSGASHPGPHAFLLSDRRRGLSTRWCSPLGRKLLSLKFPALPSEPQFLCL